MTDSATLLRMLEPVIRPGVAPGSGSGRPQSLPLEQRSFESLLDEVKQNRDLLPPPTQQTQETPPDVTPTQTTEAAQHFDPLASLRQFSVIDNASLRSQMK